MIKTTRAQREAVLRQYYRFNSSDAVTEGKIPAESYETFRRTRVSGGNGWIGVSLPWIYIGIEPDGHAHS